jgi:phosphatidate cytidylyltransferase
MGAYITGSLIGRHKLIPHISPGKTWEGLAGALAFLVARQSRLALPDAEAARGAETDTCDHPGLSLGFAAVIGDLAESLIKRSTGVKDSGNFLPASEALSTWLIACSSPRLCCSSTCGLSCSRRNRLAAFV